MSESKHASPAMRARVARRHAAEKRFRAYGIAAIAFGLLAVVVLFVSIVSKGYTAFLQTYIEIEVEYDPEVIGASGPDDLAALGSGNYPALVKKAMSDLFPEVSGRRDRRALNDLVSSGAAFILRDRVLSDPRVLGKRQRVWVPADDDVDMLIKGHMNRALPEDERRLKDSRSPGSRSSRRPTESKSDSTRRSSPPATRASRSSPGSAAP